MEDQLATHTANYNEDTTTSTDKHDVVSTSDPIDPIASLLEKMDILEHRINAMVNKFEELTAATAATRITNTNYQVDLSPEEINQLIAVQEGDNSDDPIALQQVLNKIIGDSQLLPPQAPAPDNKEDDDSSEETESVGEDGNLEYRRDSEYLRDLNAESDNSDSISNTTVNLVPKPQATATSQTCQIQ